MRSSVACREGGQAGGTAGATAWPLGFPDYNHPSCCSATEITSSRPPPCGISCTCMATRAAVMASSVSRTPATSPAAAAAWPAGSATMAGAACASMATWISLNHSSSAHRRQQMACHVASRGYKDRLLDVRRQPAAPQPGAIFPAHRCPPGSCAGSRCCPAARERLGPGAASWPGCRWHTPARAACPARLPRRTRAPPGRRAARWVCRGRRTTCSPAGSGVGAQRSAGARLAGPPDICPDIAFPTLVQA